MCIEIIDLRAFEGPNLAGPRPGVLARLRGASEPLGALPTMVKEAAQRVGIVIAYLEVTTDPAGLTELHFTSPTPLLGADLVRYAVDALCAEAVGDTSWDGEDQ